MVFLCRNKGGKAGYGKRQKKVVEKILWISGTLKRRFLNIAKSISGIFHEDTWDVLIFIQKQAEGDAGMARKRPMTTEELFDRVNGILKEIGKLPDICGEVFEFKLNDVWIPARVEMGNGRKWYLVGLPGLKLDGLEVKVE